MEALTSMTKTNEELLVDEPMGNEAMLRVTKSNYNGKVYYDFRVYFKGYPTKKGITISKELLFGVVVPSLQKQGNQ